MSNTKLNYYIDSIKRKLYSNKKILFFSLFKYIEYAINAFLFFSIAQKVTPFDYGNASSSFLLISYSGFIVLGVNQVLVKRFSVQDDNEERKHLIIYTFIYNAIFSMVLFCSIMLLFNKDYSFYIALLCSSKLITECVVSVFRVTHQIKIINFLYIHQATLFFFFYLMFVHQMDDFFQFWAISSFFGALVSTVMFLRQNFFKDFLFKRFFLFWKQKNRIFLNEGVLFTAISLIAVIYVSVDRFWYINVYKFEDTVLGTVQLADSISNLITLGISSILFIVTPNILKTLSAMDLNERILYIKKSYIWLSFLLLIIIIISVPLSVIVSRFYAQYSNITYPFLMAIIIKFLNLALFVPSMFYIVINKERSFIKISLIGAVVMQFVLVLFFLFKVNNEILFYLVPMIMLLGLLLVHFLFKYSFKNIKVETL